MIGMPINFIVTAECRQRLQILFIVIDRQRLHVKAAGSYLEQPVSFIIVEPVALGMALNHGDRLSSIAAGYDLHAGHDSKLLRLRVLKKAYSHGRGEDPGKTELTGPQVVK